MNKKGITILIIAIILLCGIGLILPKTDNTTQYLRMHVRANSNQQIDQSVKLVVRDAVVKYLTPFIAECNTFDKAKTLLTDRLSFIKQVADNALKQKGFNYESRVGVKRENFPTRVYNDVKLEEGYYDALIIELGEGKGNNWWCVVYPPLCFTGQGQNYQIRSKILDIIRNFFDKEN